jgi:hypothetical protein
MMIDKHFLARPHSGMKEGEVIVEAIAEAGITRFLVLYQQNQPAPLVPSVACVCTTSTGRNPLTAVSATRGAPRAP